MGCFYDVSSKGSCPRWIPPLLAAWSCWFWPGVPSCPAKVHRLDLFRMISSRKQFRMTHNIKTDISCSFFLHADCFFYHPNTSDVYTTAFFRFARRHGSRYGIYLPRTNIFIYPKGMGVFKIVFLGVKQGASLPPWRLASRCASSCCRTRRTTRLPCWIFWACWLETTAPSRLSSKDLSSTYW